MTPLLKANSYRDIVHRHSTLVYGLYRQGHCPLLEKAGLERNQSV
jgi:hypothetical protein